MKICVFCKDTVGISHICKKKPEGVYPNKNTNYPSTSIVPKPLNPSSSDPILPMIPQSQSRQNFTSSNLSPDSKILQHVLNFLSLFKIYNNSISSHSCDNRCFVCIIKSYYQDYNAHHISAARESLNRYYNHELDLIDFPNCLTIILNYFHAIYLKRISSDVCQYECVAHKLFGFNVFMDFVCECGLRKSFSLTPSYFIVNFTVNSDFVRSRKKNICFVHPRKIMFCPLNCVGKSSKVNASIFTQGEFVLVKVKYEEDFCDEVFEKFGMFYTENDFLKLNCFVTGRLMKIFMLDSKKSLWNEYGNDLHYRDVAGECRRNNDYPCLLVYKKT